MVVSFVDKKILFHYYNKRGRIKRKMVTI